MSSGLGIILAILAVILMGSFFGGGIGDFFSNLFGGGDDTNTPDGIPPSVQETPRDLGDKKSAINLLYKGPHIETGIRVQITPPVLVTSKYDGKERPIEIIVTNGLREKTKPLRLLLANEETNTVHIFIEDFTLNRKSFRQIFWDGKDNTGKNVEAGNYFVFAEKKDDKKAVAIASLTIRNYDDTRDREKLIRDNPWPHEIEVGLTPNLREITIERPVVNTNTSYHPDLGLEIKEFTKPEFYHIQVAVESTTNFTSQNQLLSPNDERISVKVLDVDGKGEYGPDDPFTMFLTLNFNDYFDDYFKQKKPLPAKKEFTILIDTVFEKLSEPIKVTVYLNESGLILYKSNESVSSDVDAPIESFEPTEGNSTDESVPEIIKKMALKRGWDILGVESNDPTTIQTLIQEKYDAKKFTHLLIVGSVEDIPFIDEQGLLGEKYENQVLDSAYYGNMDSDPFIELSVGRLPTTRYSNVEVYFEGLDNFETQEQNYVYVTGTENKCEISSIEGFPTDEKNKAFIRKQFLFTGNGPDFDEVEGFDVYQKRFKVAETDVGQRVYDNFSTECFENRDSIGSIANNTACDFSEIRGIPFSTFSNIVLIERESENQCSDETTLEFSEYSPPKYYSLLNFDPFFANPTIGVSLRDFLNSLISLNQAPVYHALMGDPSNIVNAHKKSQQQNQRTHVKLESDEQKIVISMPKLNLNDFFFLGNDSPFKEAEIDMIKEGHFAIADAKIIETSYPFVTDASKNRNGLNYGLILDGDLTTNDQNVIILQNFDGKIGPQDKPVKAVFGKDFKFEEYYTRLALEVYSTSGPIMEVRQAYRYHSFDKKVVMEEGEREIDGEIYNFHTLRLGDPGDNSLHPNYLDSTGTIIIENTDETKRKFKINLEIEATYIEDDAEYNTHLKFDSYTIFLEDSSSEKESKIVVEDFKVDWRTDQTEQTAEFDLMELEGYDQISVYGNTNKFTGFDFLSKPILTGKIRNKQKALLTGKTLEFENELGFLQFSDSSLVVTIFERENELGFSDVLSQVIEVNNVRALKEDKVILVETTNADHEAITFSVRETVKTILEENPKLKDKFTNPLNVLLINGDYSFDFSVIFTENVLFFSNGLSLSPHRYYNRFEGHGKSFKGVKETLKATDKSKLTTTAKSRSSNGQQFEIDMGLYFFGDEQEEANNGFGFELDLEDLFRLIESKIGDDIYRLEIEGFEQNFEEAEVAVIEPIDDIPTNEIEEINETENLTVTIARIDVGALEWNRENPIDLSKHRQKTVSVYFSTNASSFKDATLFNPANTLFGQFISFESIKTYIPGESYSITTPLGNLLNSENNQIEFTISISDPNGSNTTITSETVSISTLNG